MTTKSETFLTTGAFARELGVTTCAVRRWVRVGIVTPHRTTTGTSVFREADIRTARAYQARRRAA